MTIWSCVCHERKEEDTHRKIRFMLIAIARHTHTHAIRRILKAENEVEMAIHLCPRRAMSKWARDEIKYVIILCSAIQWATQK